jgi:hypothetical protein
MCWFTWLTLKEEALSSILAFWFPADDAAACSCLDKSGEISKSAKFKDTNEEKQV